ncbi:hypothetical protein EON63_17320 [archaeon]|nr:MAG: hypothetical protein EON63_17320 [archaeon]
MGKNLNDIKRLFLALGGAKPAGVCDVDLFFRMLSPVVADPDSEVWCMVYVCIWCILFVISCMVKFSVLSVFSILHPHHYYCTGICQAHPIISDLSKQG